MPKWEYLFVKVTGETVPLGSGPAPRPVMPVEAFLNLRGDEGWELVASDTIQGQPEHVVYMKRQKKK